MQGGLYPEANDDFRPFCLQSNVWHNFHGKFVFNGDVKNWTILVSWIIDVMKQWKRIDKLFLNYVNLNIFVSWLTKTVKKVFSRVQLTGKATL